ncbi:lasso peptide biosynthesis B2 protein, partial [Klebsiella pneumoniae]|uniref:lasso peptide biosynthesis B2 protein n=1 Tax=Klebsiella pneumoniae TaxID=573 RepID=UPI003C6D2B3B
MILGEAAGTGGDDVEAQVIWAIEATGRRLPRVSTCLVRAIVAEILLASRNRPLQVRIGIRRAVHGSGRSGGPGPPAARASAK